MTMEEALVLFALPIAIVLFGWFASKALKARPQEKGQVPDGQEVAKHPKSDVVFRTDDTSPELPGPIRASRHIADELEGLIAIAVKEDLQFLAYLLEMGRIEARALPAGSESRRENHPLSKSVSIHRYHSELTTISDDDAYGRAIA